MKSFLNNWTAVTGALALALAILVWFGLGLVLPDVASTTIRLVLVGVILGAWGIVAFMRRMKAKKANDTIANQLATASGAAEDAVVQKRMAEAIGQFKAASGGQRDYLYSRPWYVIIGPAGIGQDHRAAQFGPAVPVLRPVAQGHRRHPQPRFLVRRRGRDRRYRGALYQPGFGCIRR